MRANDGGEQSALYDGYRRDHKQQYLPLNRVIANAVIWFFLTLCGAAAAFVPSAIQGLPDRTLLA